MGATNCKWLQSTCNRNAAVSPIPQAPNSTCFGDLSDDNGSLDPQKFAVPIILYHILVQGIHILLHSFALSDASVRCQMSMSDFIGSMFDGPKAQRFLAEIQNSEPPVSVPSGKSDMKHVPNSRCPFPIGGLINRGVCLPLEMMMVFHTSPSISLPKRHDFQTVTNRLVLHHYFTI